VFDYSYDGIMRSVEQSLAPLGISRIDTLVIHDLYFGFTSMKLVSPRTWRGCGPAAAWRSKRCATRASFVVSVPESTNVQRLLDLVDIDFLLVAMPYMLLDQDVLDHEFPLCAQRNIGLIIGSVFASGILATGPVSGAICEQMQAVA
jgi:D-threo-aldose 1-dehydrogenase